MWLEMTALQAGKGFAHRQKRGWLFGQWIPEGGAGGGGAGGTSSSSFSLSDMQETMEAIRLVNQPLPLEAAMGHPSSTQTTFKLVVLATR